MKVILMAAGRGTRIAKEIGNIPKSLVDIGGGVSLISHTIQMLKNNGINDISVVVGYKHALVEKEIEKYNVKIYHNPFFAVTNSLGSLFYAKRELNDDVIIANADVFWEQDILFDLLNSQNDVTMLSDVRTIKQGDYFFNVDQNNHIVKYGKELSLEDRSCEYVGIAKIVKKFIPTFVEQFEKMLENEEYDKWWENILYSLTQSHPICSADVNGKFWAEVDFIEDYHKIKDYCKNKKG